MTPFDWNILLLGVLVGSSLTLFLPIIIHRCVKSGFAGYFRAKQLSDRKNPLGEDPRGY